jgi:glycosyltransferase involved in cell wall biosynthesis
MGWIGESPGGLNRYVFNLATALRDKGFGVDAVLVGSPEPDQGFVGVVGSAAPLPRRLSNMGLEGRARSRAADLINSHFALYTLPVLWSQRGKPLVVNFHGPWYREAATEAPEPRWRTALRKQVELAVYRRANEVIVLSDAFRRIVIDDFGILPGRVHVVRPGVDLERFRPVDPIRAREQLGLDPEQSVVLSVRRLTKRVGLDVLVRAWVAAGVNGAGLYLVGDGPERERLEALVSELGADRTVRFVGAVSDDDLPYWYAAADVSVVPSVALEGFGLVVLESLACGTPVIASDTGGMAEILPELSPRLLVAPGDGVQLTHALVGALQPLTLPAREDCRRFAESFNWTNRADRVVEIFEQTRLRPPRRKYRVVFLDHCAKLSGGELALLRLLKGARTIEPHVILAEDGPLVDEFRKAGISTEVLALKPNVANLSRAELQSPHRLLEGCIATATYAAKLTRRLHRLHPDLVHANSLKSGVYGSLAARGARIPIVWHVRDRLSEDNYPPGQAALLQRGVRKMADAVIANSIATAELLRKGRAPVWVVPSPVDVTSMGRPTDGPPVVGIVGRLAPWKGQHIFLDAVARVSKKHPDVHARVIGSALFGEEPYSRTLRRQVDELGISTLVDFAGFSDDIAAQLATLTVAVHASTVPEPFGQVIVEAMACGVPVVATAAGGPVEIIDHTTDGLLVAPGDPEELAEGIARLLEDAGLRARMSQAGMVKAERYRPERVAAEVEAVYGSVLAEKRPRRS